VREMYSKQEHIERVCKAAWEMARQAPHDFGGEQRDFYLPRLNQLIISLAILFPSQVADAVTDEDDATTQPAEVTRMRNIIRERAVTANVETMVKAVAAAYPAIDDETAHDVIESLYQLSAMTRQVQAWERAAQSIIDEHDGGFYADDLMMRGANQVRSRATEILAASALAAEEASKNE
jgi:hypothetical protein